MFSVGDKVVYPMQGVGIVERIENRIFSGKNREYIIVKILANKMEVMIPSDMIDKSNLRKISDNSTLENVLSNLTANENDDENLSTKQRYENNFNKFKVGSLKNSLEVVYDLGEINRNKKLNSSEKQLFHTAHKFLLEEVSCIKNMSLTEADDYLKNRLN
ncbi:MAG: CarD family transcriptional regulator [Clostridium sp.]|nr:CarD family transcriptional regulator [Clostridium sp.]